MNQQPRPKLLCKVLILFLAPTFLLQNSASSNSFFQTDSRAKLETTEFRSANFRMEQPLASFDNLSANSKAAISFSISGLPVSAINDVATSPTAVNFGILELNKPKTAGQRLTIKSSGWHGYQVFILRTKKLKANNSAEIEPLDTTNAHPGPWLVSPGKSGAFGYHSGDGILSGGSTRFAPADTYTGFESGPKEVAFNSRLNNSESIDMTYRVEVGVDQAIGDYTGSIMYILVPVF